MSVLGRTLRRLLSRRLVWSLFWVFLIVMIAGAVNVVGIRIVGSTDEWSRWMQSMSLYFFAWRMCLYGATAYGWWWMRSRVKRREPGPDATARLRRMETAAVLAIVALEVTVHRAS